MPAYLPVTAKSVNYAPVVFVGFVVIAYAWYMAWGRKHYQGPPTDALEHESPSNGTGAFETVKKD